MAIDNGSNDFCPVTDQRGVSRPQEGNGDGYAVCDVGAYEFVMYRLYLPLVLQNAAEKERANDLAPRAYDENKTDRGTSGDGTQIRFGTEGNDRYVQYGYGGNDTQYVSANAGNDYV